MKKSLFFLASLPLLASCASDELVDTSVPDTGSSKSYISFTTNRENITRATLLQNANHYNFGVFAYKSSDAVNNIMDNYLVGYNGNNVGYYMSDAQTTLGDPTGEYNGLSKWAYEMLGSAEYDYTAPDGYYTKDQTKYMSNVTNQYLKYWDKSAESTSFYAYTPYINKNAVATGTASFDNATKKLNIPNGSIVAAMVEGSATPEACEYMYATKTVPAADYGKDVELSFKRLMAKINIKFWEDLKGYSVKILDLTSDYGVSAAPSKPATGSTDYSQNTQGSYFESTGVDIDFSGSTPSIGWSTGATSTSDALNFKSPTATQIGTTRLEATESESSYYAIPKSDETGFTFHVSYELTSDTGERIVVQNASVFVPGDQCDWNGNTHYTYIFKITEGSNGTTGNPGTINPNDPKVDPEESLYPIVFDNCTVEDWIEKTYDPIITDPGTDTRDYSVVLSAQTITTTAAGTISVKLYQDNTELTTAPGTDPAAALSYTLTAADGSAVPTTAGVSLSGSTISVAANAQTGLYTVTWTNTNSNQSPAETYSASFYVIGHYAVSVSTAYIGTNGKAATTLKASTTNAGTAEAASSLAGTFSIVYPDGIDPDKKNSVTVDATGLVTVATNAAAGAYKVAYTTDEGICFADFNVVDYSFNLSKNSVGLAATSQDVTITTGAATLPTGADAPSPATSVYTVTTGTGISIDATTGTVTVAADAATGTYTVTRTVTLGTSTTVYEQQFAVKDVYTLTLSTNVVDNDDNSYIIITATKNGVDNIANVEYPSPMPTGITKITTAILYTAEDPETQGASPTKNVGDVKIPAGSLQVGPTCLAGTYTVKNGDQTKTFEVKD